MSDTADLDALPLRQPGGVPGFDIRFWEVLAVVVAAIGFAVIVALVTGLVMGGVDPNRAKTLAKSETYALIVLGLATLGMFVAAYLIVIMRPTDRLARLRVPANSAPRRRTGVRDWLAGGAGHGADRDRCSEGAWAAA